MNGFHPDAVVPRRTVQCSIYDRSHPGQLSAPQSAAGSSSSPGQQKWMEKQAELLIHYTLQLKEVRNYLPSTKFHKPFIQPWDCGTPSCGQEGAKSPKETLKTYLETAEKPCSNLPLPWASASPGMNRIQISQYSKDWVTLFNSISSEDLVHTGFPSACLLPQLF